MKPRTVVVVIAAVTGAVVAAVGVGLAVRDAPGAAAAPDAELRIDDDLESPRAAVGSPDGARVVVESRYNDLFVFEGDPLALARRVDTDDTPRWGFDAGLTRAVAVSARYEDGTRIEDDVAIWDLETGEIVRELTATMSDTDAALSPDGRSLALVSGDSTIAVIDVESGRVEDRIETSEAATEVIEIAWPAPRTLVVESASLARRTEAIDLDTGARIWSEPNVTIHAVLPAAGLVVVSDADGDSGRALRLADGSPVETFPAVTERDAVIESASAQAPSVAVSRPDGTVDLWAATTEETVRTVSEHGTALGWSTYGAALVLRLDDDDDELLVVPADPDASTRRLRADHSGGIEAGVWSPDFGFVAVGRDGTLYIWTEIDV